jgi:hypothetical protein
MPTHRPLPTREPEAGTGSAGACAGPTRRPDAGLRADRWAWRARIRRNPATRRLYRLTVGVVGGVLILLAAVTGPLPGPGGIPLALLGLAVLASEFAWAARLLDRVKRAVIRAGKWARRQPAWLQRIGAVATAGVMVTAVYVYLLALGVPGWLPEDVRGPLLSVPGLS